ncbi:TetR/AcrR family transcriptional regulator [Sphingobium sp. TB-6]|uniref:TetR/AcrR family transcriptional regulator n=1 Tax=Sphingobium sp. TB-6 TaxID=2728850 RepID=UPI000B3C10D0|nr:MULTISPECIES: TetR/AcrR family transcriptional regulator [Sphingomonadaceae]NML87597.1 TetR/AcrR family transcriptional regulator [Sphingobium sp. TB-6]
MTAPSIIGNIRAARSALEAETRSTLLSAAAALLSEEGPGALTVRRVAETAGASTKMIYTHFGGKDGLLEALYLHSFAELVLAFQAHAGEADSARRLALMLGAYRSFALDEPALYNVMFGDLGRAWEAPAACRKQAWRSFETLRDAVRDDLPADRRLDAQHVTYALWATAHGVVSLEHRKLIGPTSGAAAIFDSALNAICAANGMRCKLQTHP